MSLLHVHVNVVVKPGQAEAFIAATRENASNSRKEPGVVRFDLLQHPDHPERFLLIEIYRDQAAAAAHKQTEHYATWRDTVADLMAEPRTSIKLVNIDPPDTAWS